MEKVELPRDVAEELQRLRNEGWTDYHIISDIFRQWEKGEAYSPMAEFANQKGRPFLRALADGYEVEETPEDKVRELYEMHAPYGIGQEKRTVIQMVLNALNIKIEGVND